MTRMLMLVSLACIATVVAANDAINSTDGVLKSKVMVMHVHPVRIHYGLVEIQTDDAKYHFEMRETDAELKYDIGDINTFRWHWSLYNSGGGGSYVTDIVVHMKDNTVFETVELRWPQDLFMSAVKPTIKDVVPEARQKEFDAISANGTLAVSNRFPNAARLEQRLVIFAEHEKTRAYLTLVRFTVDDQKRWALIRGIVDGDHLQTDLMRISTDGCIRDYQAYRVIPKMSVKSESEHATLDLDALNLPASCTIDEIKEP
jgi:hypothetical protein